ncbi:preferentially expressed antigen in melanoma-like protein 7 [Arvicanthis niloticus]|uniref:preferentially expressed antigen in melanoma-like protein 7 n=1 Tax=Arvicanthis niloticus TaxID=61156 RepID=UPI00148647C0|nr:preferentially expressed antigen in melanoma-like protein 7 [Arvicanthis niloticus]
MVYGSPPSLQELALQCLVRNEGLTDSVLENLPKVFFSPLFKEADIQRKTTMIKSLVEYWPYSSLHVGLLINKPKLQNLQAILDGLDTWLKRKYRPRKTRLQVVDLNGYASSDMQDGREGRDHLVETKLEGQVVEGFSRYTRKCLRVFIDLSFMSSRHEDEYQIQLLQWAKNKKDSLHLCCENLEIGAIEVSKVREELNILQLEYVKQLELNTVGSISKLAKLIPCISKMRNLQKLMLVRIFGTRTYTREENDNVTKIMSLFPKLTCLQDLTIDDVYFLTDHMEELFRCLGASLVSLKITLCQLSQSDLVSFAQDWNYSQLKHLCLRGATLTYLNIMPLKLFLDSVADNLQTLELEDCRMNDSHLSVLLPALIQCLQLTSINLFDNDISMDALKKFLLNTTHMSQLTTEMYPAPVEVYNESNYVDVETFSELCAELKDELSAVRQPKSICFGSYYCYDCDTRYTYEDDVMFCLCVE